ncbi:182aa long hypothetical protein [Pyrococcus horikoshii OT3]|uniref:Uncharacterized protein n=1 Tax=Pyrococcus horikoshii (strain ATCC 700860 / DSM 12428 / JCM 9974 / NBRC 100139 / OT-3) TaxID=70601 RepID=O57725_PYRHO|nr:182aa long hypothetical protein [Pyrococcus horikoshii OT3]
MDLISPSNLSILASNVLSILILPSSVSTMTPPIVSTVSPSSIETSPSSDFISSILEAIKPNVFSFDITLTFFSLSSLIASFSNALTDSKYSSSLMVSSLLLTSSRTLEIISSCMASRFLLTSSLAFAIILCFSSSACVFALLIIHSALASAFLLASSLIFSACCLASLSMYSIFLSASLFIS